MSVGQLGALGIQFEHLRFGLRQRFVPGWIETARIFQVRPKMGLEEWCGQFVMLGIGGLRVDRDRACAQVVEQAAQPLCTKLAVPGTFVAQATSHLLPHAEPDQRVGQPAAFATPDQQSVIGARTKR